MMGVRITTWNVNGIRNPFSYQPWRDKKSFMAMFDVLEADIVVFQETKIQRKDLKDDMVLVPGWDCYFSLPKHEKGKFGVVIYTRQSVCAPIRAEEGITGVLCPPNSSTSFRDLPTPDQIGGYPSEAQALDAASAPDLASDFTTLDSEGRCVILEFPAFVLLGVYSPATRDSTRNAFRIGYQNLLDIRIRNLVAMGKRVILTGDLNVSKSELDMANSEAELRKMQLTPEEFFSMPSRRLFNHLLEDGTVWGARDEGRETPVLHDVCRSFHPHRKGMFTHWETKINARPGNYGSRIDFVLCSLDMKDWFSDSNIQEGLMGSDHCPVYAVFKEKVKIDGEDVVVQDLLNPNGMFKDGARQREYSAKDILPLSGRLIPEFNGRRSIRDMFTSKPLTTLAISRSTATELTPREERQRGQGSSTLSPRSKDKADAQDYGRHQEISSAIVEATPPTPVLDGPSLGDKRGPAEPPARPNAKKTRKESTPATPPSKGQMNLKGFFKPKPVPSAPTPAASEPHKELPTTTSATRTPPPSSTPQGQLDGSNEQTPPQTPEVVPASNLQDNSTTTTTSPADPTIPPLATSTTPDASSSSSPFPSFPVHDPIESKETWSKLFSKPNAPRCEGHREPCKTMVTKKPGVNCGRSFWMCARPLGPSGGKERGTQWRCGTFVWCSEVGNYEDG